MKLDNRRKFQRINFDGLANVTFTTGKHDCCRIKNLSLAGMCVTGNFKQYQQKKCQIKIFHNNKSDNNCLHALGEVVWCNDESVGLRFTSMTLEHYILLQTTLIDEAEQPGIILREFPPHGPFEVFAN